MLSWSPLCPKKRTLLASSGSWGASGTWGWGVERKQDVVPKWAFVHKAGSFETPRLLSAPEG